MPRPPPPTSPPISKTKLREVALGILLGPVKLLLAREWHEAMARAGAKMIAEDFALLIEELLDRGAIEQTTFKGRAAFRLRDQALGPVVHPSLAGEPGTPYAAFRRAETLYLQRSNWTLVERLGRWTHPTNTRQSYWTEAALLLQIHADESLLVRKGLGLAVHSRPLATRTIKKPRASRRRSPAPT